MRWLVCAMTMWLVTACSSKGATGPGTGGNGGEGGAIDPTPATSCDGARKRIEQLYRADADARKEKAERIADYVTNICELVVYMKRGAVIKHVIEE